MTDFFFQNNINFRTILLIGTFSKQFMKLTPQVQETQFQLNSVSFKLKSSLTDSISQPCSLTHSVSRSLTPIDNNNNQETLNKTNETSIIRKPKRSKENQEQESRNPPKDLKRNINKPRRRCLEPSPPGSFDVVISLVFFFCLRGFGFVLLVLRGLR